MFWQAAMKTFFTILLEKITAMIHHNHLIDDIMRIFNVFKVHVRIVLLIRSYLLPGATSIPSIIALPWNIKVSVIANALALLNFAVNYSSNQRLPFFALLLTALILNRLLFCKFEFFIEIIALYLSIKEIPTYSFYFFMQHFSITCITSVFSLYSLVCTCRHRSSSITE